MTLFPKDFGPERCLAYGFSDIAFPSQTGQALAVAGQSGQVADVLPLCSLPFSKVLCGCRLDAMLPVT